MNPTPYRHQTTAATGDHADLGVADRAVNATKVYGKGDAEVRALDGVTVDFATSRFTSSASSCWPRLWPRSWQPPSRPAGRPGSTSSRPSAPSNQGTVDR